MKVLLPEREAAGTCTQVHALVLQTGNGSRRKKAQNRVIFSCRDCDLRGAHARNQRICHTFEVGLDVWLDMGAYRDASGSPRERNVQSDSHRNVHAEWLLVALKDSLGVFSIFKNVLFAGVVAQWDQQGTPKSPDV